MIIGFIGSGNIGSHIARRAVAGGHEVVMSNRRGPSALADLIQDLGPHARAAASTAEAAQSADVVVLATPMIEYTTLPMPALRGKIVIDATVYEPRFGAIADLDHDRTTSSELVQAHLPGHRS